MSRNEQRRMLPWASWAGLLAVLAAGLANSGPGLGISVREAGAEPAIGDTLAPKLVFIVWTDAPPGEAPPPFRNGNIIRVETHWDRSDLEVEIVNLNIVSAEDDTVALTNLGGGTYQLEYTIPDPNPNIGDGHKNLSFTATTPAGVDTTVTDNRLCLTNSPPGTTESSLVPDRTRFQAIDYLFLSSRWTSASGLDLEVFLDASAVDSSLAGTLLPATFNDENSRWEIAYTIPNDPVGRAPDGKSLPLIWVGIDSGCGVTRDTSHVITLDHAPIEPPTLLSWEFLSPLENGEPRALRDGDTLRLLTRWDRDEIGVSADLSDLAPGDTSRAVVIRQGPAEYEIIYNLPDTSPREDGSGIRMTLAAEGPPGAVRVDRSVSLCLSNHVPLHLETRILTAREIYTGGDSLRISTRWTTESGLPLKVGAQFEQLQPALGDSIWLGLAQGDSTVIVFRIPTIRDDRGSDGTLQIPIVAREIDGCGRAFFDQIFIELDTSAPDTTGPILDLLPEQTSADSILVSGTTVPTAARVNIERDRSHQLFTPVDPVTGRFSAMLALKLNEVNPITAKAEDELGNSTASSTTMLVRQVATRHIIFESPFPRNEEISIQDPRGMTDLTLSIYDLEGSLVQRWRTIGRRLEFDTPWDGQDEKGGRARQGYYLVRGTWRDDDGRLRDATEGLILAN